MRRVVLALWLVAAAGLPVSASATHNGDAHRNMQLLATVPPETSLGLPGNTYQSDLAFWGNRAYVGNYDGFRIFDISTPARPRRLSSYTCRGPQNDVSVWRNRLLFLSIDAPQSDSPDPAAPNGACTGDALVDPEDPRNFEGIRIFDVRDPANPRFVKGVDTDCGSHTHTLVPDLSRNRILLYISSYSLEVGPVCGPNTSGRDGESNPRHAQISIVAVPLANPSAARVIAEPKLDHPAFGADPEDSGSNPSIGCHDISVFLDLDLAAASCMSNGQLWDISNRARPKTRRSEGAKFVDLRQVQFWHSATFSWDGKIVVFGDESLTGSCLSTREGHGRLWFYRRARFTRPVGSFMIPRPQVGTTSATDQYCSTHLFNVVPGIRRYLLASSWYMGGTNVVDFTNPARPREIGFYDAARSELSLASIGGAWASYWYNGVIPSNDIDRGFEIFRFTGRATRGAARLPFLNPQTQHDLQRGRAGRS
ncbi:MAG: hypothetical protein M3198_04310 [Actinomycetota bacterium]|nr:hypothetical protein [Actinomycetota bacterium]